MSEILVKNEWILYLAGHASDCGGKEWQNGESFKYKQLLPYNQLPENMPRMTLALSDELKEKLDHRPDINWAERFRTILKQRVEQLKKLEKARS